MDDVPEIESLYQQIIPFNHKGDPAGNINGSAGLGLNGDEIRGSAVIGELALCINVACIVDAAGKVNEVSWLSCGYNRAVGICNQLAVDLVHQSLETIDGI